MRKVAVLAGGVLSLLLTSGAAFADGCKPALAASLDMIDEPDGRIAVAVGLAGAQHRMLISTTGSHSEMFEAAVTAAGYRKLELSELKTFDMFGGHASGYTEVDSMTLGSMRGGKVDMLVTPGPYRGDAEVAGILAADLLGNFDVDLDFANHKVNLLSSAACNGSPPDLGTQFTGLAMSDLTGEPLDAANRRATTAMMLDGKPVLVALDTLATSMRLRFDVAKPRFGLTPSSPGVVALPARGDRQAYGYAFHTLTANGIAIDNPKIILAGDPDAPPCNGQTHPRLGRLPGMYSTVTCRTDGEMTLGVHWIRGRHMYFAYKAGMIYFAPLGPH